MFRVLTRATCRRSSLAASSSAGRKHVAPATPIFRVTSRSFANKNPEVYLGYDATRTLEDVDVYAATSLKQPPVPSTQDLFGHKEYTFKKHFLTGSAANIHHVKEGGYMELDEADIKKYFPDGFIGDIEKEFEYSENKAWMIRDSTKLLCRIIEEFDEAKSRTDGKPIDESNREATLKQTVSLRPQVAGLTDRPPRKDESMKVYMYGKQINQEARPNIGNFDIIAGQGSLVEDCVEKIKIGDSYHGPKFPKQIMVTGILFFCPCGRISLFFRR
jgi:hypothetical protein